MKRATVEELTKNGKYNRYSLVIATSKRAREITEELEEKSLSLDPSTMTQDELDQLNELRDEKPLKTSIEMFRQGEYDIIEDSLDLNATH